MTERFARTELLLGAEALRRLKDARVAVFGIGGVGGHAAEALARSGVGALDLLDNYRVSNSNMNQQIVALQSTVERYKTEVMWGPILDVNQEAAVRGKS